MFADDKRKLSARSGSKRSRQNRQNRNRHCDLALALFGPECGHAVTNVLAAKPYGVAASEARIEQYVEPDALLAADRPLAAVLLNVGLGPDWEAVGLRPSRVLNPQCWIVFHKLRLGGPPE